MPVSQVQRRDPGVSGSPGSRVWSACVASATELGCRVRKCQQWFPGGPGRPPRLQSVNFTPRLRGARVGPGGQASHFLKWASGRGLCGYQAQVVNLLKGLLGQEPAEGEGTAEGHTGESELAGLTCTRRVWAPRSWPLCTRPGPGPLGGLPGSIVPPPHLSSTGTKKSPPQGHGGNSGILCPSAQHFRFRKHFTDVISFH